MSSPEQHSIRDLLESRSMIRVDARIAAAREKFTSEVVEYCSGLSAESLSTNDSHILELYESVKSFLVSVVQAYSTTDEAFALADSSENYGLILRHQILPFVLRQIGEEALQILRYDGANQITDSEDAKSKFQVAFFANARDNWSDVSTRIRLDLEKEFSDLEDRYLEARANSSAEPDISGDDENPKASSAESSIDLETCVLEVVGQTEGKDSNLVLTCESKAFNCKMSVWQDRQR